MFKVCVNVLICLSLPKKSLKHKLFFQERMDILLCFILLWKFTKTSIFLHVSKSQKNVYFAHRVHSMEPISCNLTINTFLLDIKKWRIPRAEKVILMCLNDPKKYKFFFCIFIFIYLYRLLNIILILGSLTLTIGIIAFWWTDGGGSEKP